MPLSKNEIALLGNPSAQVIEYEHQRLDRAPVQDSKIGKWTVVLLILNRTIGSGIFLTPHRVLAGAGCVGGALFLWVLGALLSICGLYVWLECGLSMPQRTIQGEAEPRGVPRSGGEKNFLEFMFPNRNHRLKHIRTTCAFAMMFLLMYNLSGNAISFALQAMKASGLHDPRSQEVPSRSTAIGIAIAALSFVVLSHSISRRGGILINNGFALVKIALLLAIICLGIAKAAGAFGGPGDVLRNNFAMDAFTTQRHDPVSWSDSLSLCMYAFSGYEQPFYVLAETKSPRRTLPKYTLLAMVFATVLFVLVNISYLLVVDKSLVIPATAGESPPGIDLATLFFDRLFGDKDGKADRAMAALIAISIFGNLWVMTFTASRIKAEIAKEGILPWSLIIATSYRTPFGMWKKYMRRQPNDDEVETAPTAAFALHWLTSILLVIVVSPISDPRKAYAALVSLYTYTIVTLLGFWVAAGLLMVKWRKSTWNWQDRRRYRPWLSPLHAIIYAMATAFMLITAFMPPSKASPYHEHVSGMPAWLIPAIGLTAPFWGVLYYWGLLAYEWKTERELVVTREAYWMQDPGCPGEYVQVAEIIDQSFEIKDRKADPDGFDSREGSDAPAPTRTAGGGQRNLRRLDRDVENGPVAASRRLSDSF